MNNITLALDESTHRTARIVAAERGQSVSAMVRDYLTSLKPSQQDARVRALAETFEWANPDYRASDRLSREQANERIG